MPTRDLEGLVLSGDDHVPTAIATLRPHVGLFSSQDLTFLHQPPRPPSHSSYSTVCVTNLLNPVEKMNPTGCVRFLP